MSIKIYIFTLLFLLLTINNVWASDDNFYSISDNILISNDYKIVFNELIITDQNYSGILIDDNNLYIHTTKSFYIINKTTGDIPFQIMISNIINQAQTDNFIYLQTNYNIYKINKTSGFIDDKRIYINSLKNIYTFFGVSGISGTVINNYYVCGNCTNGTNGTNGVDGINGLNGTNGIDGLNGTNGHNGSVSSSVTYFLHNTSLSLPYASKDMDENLNVSLPIAYTNISSIPNGVTLIQNWTSNEVVTSFIPHGVHTLHIDAMKTGGSGIHTITLYFEDGYVSQDGGNYTYLGTSEYSSNILLNVNNEVNLDLLLEDINLNSTDRKTVRLYALVTGIGLAPSLSISYSDRTDSRLIRPSSGGNIAQMQLDIAGKLNKSGDNMTGNLTFENNKTIQYSPYPFANIVSNISNYTTYPNGGYYDTPSTNDHGTIWYTSILNVSSDSNTEILQANFSAIGSGNARLALYSGNKTWPSTLLNQSSSISIPSTGWVNFSIPLTVRYNGTQYWIGMQVDNINVGNIYRSDPGGGRRTPYSYNTFPSSAGAGGTTISFDMRALGYTFTSSISSFESYACFNSSGYLYAKLTPCGT